MSDVLTAASASDGPRSLFNGLTNNEPARIMSREDCEALFKRIVGLTAGGGDTSLTIRCTWTANLRWARNRPTTSGDTIEYSATITRVMPGKEATTELAQLDDATLKEAIHTLETRLSSMKPGNSDPGSEMLTKQQYLKGPLWSDATYQMKAKDLSESARMSVDPVVDAKLDAAGYSELGAVSWAIFNTRGLDAYAAATGVLYAQTVRNQEGTASGWAGKSHSDWSKLDVKRLSTKALKCCIDSANPRAIEPGRYTTILEPDVVSRMMSFAVEAMDREPAERGGTVYTKSQGVSKIGDQIFDNRITVTSDPTDPDCAYIPFDTDGVPHRKVNWVENGILKELSYDRAYARKRLNSDVALPNPMAFKISGGNTSIEEMIATTERGVYVNNTTGLAMDDPSTLSLTCLTRNGLWLIEHGKIVHPIKNFWINDSPMVVFNQVLQIGPAVRTYGARRSGWGGALRDIPSRALNDGRMPIVAPPMKVKDFNFTRLSDAI